MKEFKKLYECTIDKEVEVEESQVSKNDKGEEVKTTVKVKKNVPVKVMIRKPSRKFLDEAETFYAISVSKDVAGGVLSRAMLRKYLLNTGGVLSEEEKKLATNLYNRWFTLSNDFQHASLKPEEERTEEEKKKLEKMMVELTETQRNIQEYESQQQALFDNTAEARARNKTIIFYTLNLTYTQGPDDFEPQVYFKGDTVEDKYESYDELEDASDPFYLKLIERATLAVTMFYSGLASSQEEFDSLVKRLSENK